MTTYTPPAFLEKMNTKLFFFLIFIYQVLIIFQGFDIADEGFHATFYQQIYNDPESVQFNFMFWFSGIVGGAFDYLFSGLGLWGTRFAGVLVTTSTLMVTYQLLKKYLNAGHLKLGLLLVILLLNNNRKTLYYDNLSILLYCIIALYLFNGLKENKWWKFFLAGFLAALTVFTRLPNVCSAGLVVIILYYGFLYKNSLKVQIRQVLSFTGGFIFAIAAVLLFMKLIGHFDIYVQSLKLVFKLGADENNPNYGFMNLLFNYYSPYVIALRTTIIILALVVFAAVIGNIIKSKSFFATLLKWALRLGVLLALVFLLIKDKHENVVSLYFFTGLSILTGIVILITSKDKDIKVLTLIGGFIVMVYPFGSSSGLFTVGIHTFWIAFPVIISYLFSVRSLSNHLSLFSKEDYSLKLTLTSEQLSRIRTYALLFLAVICLYHVYFYPYFDQSNRIKMHYSLNNKYLKGIFTTKERAQSFNELLAESSKYIQPGDPVLAYDCLPVFHYVTKTRPYIRNSWPYLYQKDIFKEELDSAYAKTKKLPVVVLQTIKTIGSGSDWPTTPLKYDTEWVERNKGRNAFLNEFLDKNNYKEVWTNGMFKIMLPVKDPL